MTKEKKVALSLWSIADEMNALDELLAMEGGEITEEYEVLEQEVIGMLRLKTDSVIGYIEYLKNNVDVAKDKIAGLNDFKKVTENKLKRFEQMVRDCFDKMEIESFKGDFKEIKRRKPVDIVVIDDENEIPMEFQVVETSVKIKKAEIKKALKNGEKVPGAYLKKGLPGVMTGIRK